MRAFTSIKSAPQSSKFTSALPLVVLLVLMSCQGTTPSDGAPAAWTSVGRTTEVTHEPASHVDAVRRTAAIEARRQGQSPESARALAQAYFPEFATSATVSESTHDERHALTVTTNGDRTLELTTRGLRFRVESRSGIGAEHFFAPTERFHGSDAAVWKTPRVEEYWVRDAASGIHHAEYEVALPKEITRLHDAGEYLEFLNADDVPVLRFHPSVVRDAEGRTRTGTVELAGAEPTGEHLYAVGERIHLATTVSLEGLAPPLVVDPGWSSAASMAAARWTQTATLLPSGKVLVVGGWGPSSTLATAELYDPTTNTWSAAGNLTTARSDHTATLLPSGKVLVAGGFGTATLSSAELYDPTTNTWSAAGSLATARYRHTATLLSSGKVLVTGGQGTGDSARVSTELYDPTTNTWSAAGSLTTARAWHTATLLPSGKVLVTSGSGIGYSALVSTELYDPATDTWSAAGNLTAARYEQTATLLPSGKVLVTGGRGIPSLSSAELYDPGTNTWSAAGSLATARHSHTATLLPSGKVLVTGGSGLSALSSVELYDPGTNTWSSAGTLTSVRMYQTAVLLPSGKVLVAGGYGTNDPLATAEMYDPGTNVWSAAGSLGTARERHTATLMPSGRVFVTGGLGNATGTLKTTETYNPATNAWVASNSLSTVRSQHTATLLSSGKVLAVGGFDGAALATGQLYNPATGTWNTAGSLIAARYGHTATLLQSGKVLVVGGYASNNYQTASAELYDPATNTWSAAGGVGFERVGHTATLLPSGKVLIVGGYGLNNAVFDDARLYDPATNKWSMAGPLATARHRHTATLLPSGKVLVVGGYGSSSVTSVELYDPGTNTWSAAGTFSARGLHTATLLPSGRVLIVGGYDGSSVLSSTRVYDPVTSTTSASGTLSTARYYHTATLLPSGKVLILGGLSSTAGGNTLASAELYDETGALEAWRPVVTGPTSIDAVSAAVVTGTGFRGLSGGGTGATNDSPTDFPVVRLRSLANDQIWTRPGTSMSGTSVTIAPPDAPTGYYLLTVTVNGITGGLVVFFLANEAPVISGAPSNQTVEATGPDGAVVSWTAPTASDDRDTSVTVICAPASGSTFAVGTHTATCSATDSGGKTTSVSFTVTVRDTTAPTLTVPANFAVEATGPTGAVVTYSVSATDIVDVTPPVTCAPASGSTFIVGTSVVSCEAIDSRGNKTVKAFEVTVRDTAAPTIACPSNLTLEATSASGAIATYSATATDLVTTSPTLTYSTPSGSTFAPGTVTVTATAKDAANNTASCTFTVTVQDTTAPTLTCPANVTVEATSFSGDPATFTATATDAVTSSPTLTYSHASGSVFPMGPTTVTVTAKDAANNSASCSFTVTVQDTTAPALTCPTNLVVEASDASGAIVSYSNASALDAVTSSLSISYSKNTGSLFPLGTTTVTASTTDAANNTGSCTFTVKVQDTTKPTITCGMSVTVEATSSAGAIATYTAATSSDAVSTPTITYSRESGASFVLGETIVTATATDEAGNAETCTLKVLVRDTTAPAVTCPATITVEAAASLGAPASWVAITATDAVTSSPNVTASRASGSIFPLGETMVDVTATDAANNQSSCQFIVRVVDTTAPQVTCPADVVEEATASDGATVFFGQPVTRDDVSTVTTTLSATNGSTFALGTTTVQVTAQDVAGNKGSCTFKVTVQDTTAPQLMCPADVVEEATGAGGALVTFGAPVTSDLVSTPTVTTSRASMTQFPLGETQVDVSATDAANNKATCSFAVKVQDTTAPVLLAPADLTLEATSAEGAVASYPAVTATDLVTASPTIVFDPAPGAQLTLGTTTITVTATDAAGNAAQDTFRVNVVDTTAPLLQCPANVEVTAENDIGAMVTLPAPTVSDAVTADPKVTFDQPTAGIYLVGTTKVVATTKDTAGNMATCDFTVTVKAQETPPSKPVKAGCGCSSDSPASTVAGLVVLGLALMRRRMQRVSM